MVWIDRYFGIGAAGSTVPRELRAGLTTFLTMSYILFVNPLVLGNAIVLENGFAKLLVVTAIAAAIGSLLMGLLARYPFAQAPGMGLNAYFAYTVVLGQKIPWQTALGAVFISGALFVILSLIGARQAGGARDPQSLEVCRDRRYRDVLGVHRLQERGCRDCESGDAGDARARSVRPRY